MKAARVVDWARLPELLHRKDALEIAGWCVATFQRAARTCPGLRVRVPWMARKRMVRRDALKNILEGNTQ